MKCSNKADMRILVEGDERLFNPYGVMLVSPEKCPTVNEKAGQAFIDWLVSEAGQRRSLLIRSREQVFFANAKPFPDRYLI